MLTAYATVLVFMLVAWAFVLGSMLAGKLVRPRLSFAQREERGAKLATYESGEEATSGAWFNFNPRFYLVALVFLIFDVEIALIYPVAVVFKRLVAGGARSSRSSRSSGCSCSVSRTCGKRETSSGSGHSTASA